MLAFYLRGLECQPQNLQQYKTTCRQNEYEGGEGKHQIAVVWSGCHQHGHLEIVTSGRLALAVDLIPAIGGTPMQVRDGKEPSGRAAARSAVAA